MRAIWYVARHEYSKRIRKRSFLLGTVGFPFLILVVMALSIWIAIGAENSQPVGYVDYAGILPAPEMGPFRRAYSDLQFIPYGDQDLAVAALQKGEIQAFYIVSSTYQSTGKIEAYYWDESPGNNVQSSMTALLRESLAAGLEPQARQLLTEGISFRLRSLDGSPEISSQNVLVFLLPFFTGFIFIITVMATAGYMLQVVTDEKENKTIEVLLTSLTPEQLIGGKSLGLIALALTLVLIWLLTASAGIYAASFFLEPLRGLVIPWKFLGIVFLFFIPSFALISGLMTAVGGAVTELRHGQQIAGFFNLFFIAPYLISAAAFAHPDSPLMVFMTLFPSTALVAITLRWGFTSIPLWQLMVSFLLLVSAAVFSVWASARIFRAGMLLTGKGLNLRAALKALRAQ
jgi:ABC-2 type transport system permease protein